MTLKQWLRKRDDGMRAADLAKKLGVSEAAVSRWLAREVTPRVEVAIAIERLTGGQVRVPDLRATAGGRQRRAARAAGGAA